eukprot:PhM_4_TR12925/c0_g1_i1/m.2526
MNAIPHDDLLVAFSYLPLAELVHTVPFVSRLWRDASRDDRVWRSWCSMRFPRATHIHLNDNKNYDNNAWYDAFAQWSQNVFSSERPLTTTHRSMLDNLWHLIPFRQQRQHRVPMLGLADVGKSSLLTKMMHSPSGTKFAYSHTSGQFGDLSILCCPPRFVSSSGHHNFVGSGGVIFVVDSTDVGRLEEAAGALRSIFEHHSPHLDAAAVGTVQQAGPAGRARTVRGWCRAWRCSGSVRWSSAVADRRSVRAFVFGLRCSSELAVH